jgi:hypothetical protein
MYSGRPPVAGSEVFTCGGTRGTAADGDIDLGGRVVGDKGLGKGGSRTHRTQLQSKLAARTTVMSKEQTGLHM